MFVNAFEFEVTAASGELYPLSLRLGVGGQLKLKKKYNESTTDTLFGAVDDIERFVDVIQNSLTYFGNTNKITSAERLIDLMAENDMLGMAARQKIITALGRASGIFSEGEKSAIDKRADKMIDGLFDEGAAPETAEKNG